MASSTNPMEHHDLLASNSHDCVFHLPPARPESILVLQLLLSAKFPDLGAVTDIIRCDIGLVIQTMRLVAMELHPRDVVPTRIEDVAVLLGINKLQALSETASVLATRPRVLPALRLFDQFSAHAQLTGLIAQQMAVETGAVDPEKAYLGGLFRHLTVLPAVLGWGALEVCPEPNDALARQLASDWALPHTFVPVIAGNREDCPVESLALFDLINAADARALNLESGYEN